MEGATEVILRKPPGVTDVISFTSFYFIGLVNNGNEVIKYPHLPTDEDAYKQLMVEAEFYKMLQPSGQPHERIIEFKRIDEHGLYLEYAVNGCISKYLACNNPSNEVRLGWALQAAEGMAYIHQKGVLHCDVNCNNLLLDEKFNVKYVDFQGRCYAQDGTLSLNGLSEENVKSYMPRNGDFAKCMTDIFALGCAIYHMVTGEYPFPDLDPNDHETEIAYRWSSQQFPEHPLLGNVRPILVKCWTGSYASASDLAKYLRELNLKK